MLCELCFIQGYTTDIDYMPDYISNKWPQKQFSLPDLESINLVTEPLLLVEKPCISCLSEKQKTNRNKRHICPWSTEGTDLIASFHTPLVYVGHCQLRESDRGKTFTPSALREKKTLLKCHWPVLQGHDVIFWVVSKLLYTLSIWPVGSPPSTQTKQKINNSPGSQIWSKNSTALPTALPLFIYRSKIFCTAFYRLILQVIITRVMNTMTYFRHYFSQYCMELSIDSDVLILLNSHSYNFIIIF